jgi:hypothetical protein
MGFHEVDGTNVENRAEDDHHRVRERPSVREVNTFQKEPSGYQRIQSDPWV